MVEDAKIKPVNLDRAVKDEDMNQIDSGDASIEDAMGGALQD